MPTIDDASVEAVIPIGVQQGAYYVGMRNLLDNYEAAPM
jgi:hypothetical protein